LRGPPHQTPFGLRYRSLAWRLHEFFVNAKRGLRYLSPNGLFLLARLGNMRSIRDRADHVGSLSDAYRTFADRLRALADRFQSREIVELINGYREA
jgi:hypothetical protein